MFSKTSIWVFLLWDRNLIFAFIYVSDLCRESWGANLRCVFFLLGNSPNETINQLAQTEMALNQDILQIPIIDEYSHLTEKVGDKSLGSEI